MAEKKLAFESETWDDFCNNDSTHENTAEASIVQEDSHTAKDTPVVSEEPVAEVNEENEIEAEDEALPEREIKQPVTIETLDEGDDVENLRRSAREYQTTGESLNPEDFGATVIDERDQSHEKETVSDKKKSFQDVTGTGKVSRLKKDKLLVVVAATVFVLFGAVTIFASMANRKKETARENKPDVATGYTPSFDTSVDSDSSTPQKAEVPVTRENVKFKEPPKYTGTAPARKATPKQEETYYDKDALKAPLKKSASGFGSGGTESVASYDDIKNPEKYTYTGTAPTVTTGGNIGDYTKDSLERISQLSGNSGDGSSYGYDKVNNGRYTQNGAYKSKNTEGGNIKVLPQNTLFPGTIIHAVLTSAINTDYPADITARTIENVYDSETGHVLLIPQGSILKGAYSSSSIGIASVQIAWDTLIISKDRRTYMVALGGMAGVDKTGKAGINGTINDHYFQYLKAAGIMALFSVVSSEATNLNKKIANETVTNVVSDTSDIVTKIGDKLTDRALDIQPTVTIPNGREVSISVNTPLTLAAFDPVKPTEKYFRY